MKHTAKPWNVAIYDHETKGKGAMTRIETTTDSVCEVFDLWREGATIETAKEEKAANARLIASAPELLEACQYTLDNLEAAINEKLITAPKNFQIQLTESRKKLRAAIITAEGN